MARRNRGRPQGQSSTREAIVVEARSQFGDVGYRATTLRSIGTAAGVDPRLLLHYFGSKKELFLATVELPVDPAQLVEAVFAGGTEDVARRAVEFMLDVISEPRSQRAFTGLLRAAVSEPDAAELIRELLGARLLTPIAERVGGDEPRLRASMIATVTIGLAIGRHVVALEPLERARRDQLVRALTPVVEHYLTGDWVALRTAEGEDFS